MRVIYDPESDTLYIRFKEAPITTKHVAEGISADYDEDGNLAGIEVLEANKKLGNKEVFRMAFIDDLLALDYFQ